MSNDRPKKRGRVPGTPTVRTTLLLEEDLVEWGKIQPGGLSELVRDLLREAKERQESAERLPGLPSKPYELNSPTRVMDITPDDVPKQ
jgi:hypothetical protein